MEQAVKKTNPERDDTQRKSQSADGPNRKKDQLSELELPLSLKLQRKNENVPLKELLLENVFWGKTLTLFGH